MADMLNNAVSGLLSFQRALSTTSHNIANVSTEGYSRQRVSIQANTPSSIGSLVVGNGAHVSSVDRVFDRFLTSDLRLASSVSGKLDMYTELARYVDDVLADPAGGISPLMHDFFAAVQDVADDPNSISARNNMINVASSLSAGFQNMDNRFKQLELNTTRDIRGVVEEINKLVEDIADVNEAINKLQFGGGSQQSADLLDLRDQLILELSQKIDISVLNEDAGSMSIFIGNGQTLVNGSIASTLGTIPSSADPSQDLIVYQGLSSPVDISGSLRGGGELGALLEFRDQLLKDTRNDLGRIAIALADTFNTQHSNGMDLNGNLGGDFFSVASPKVLSFAGNPGTASITTSISDVGVLTRSDYTLAFDGSSWRLSSDSGTVSGAVADASPANTTLTFEGITLTIDGVASSPAAGDQYRIKPTSGGAGSFNVAISDPLLISAAAPVRSATSLNNLGTTAITAGVVTDVTNPALLNTVTLTFDTPPGTFRSTSNVTVGTTVFAAGAAIPYSNGMRIDSNGWQTTLSGVPQGNDVLTVESNAGGKGDSRNVLLLANLQTSGTLDNGNSNYQEAYSVLVGRVASQTASADTQREAAQSLLIQAQGRRDAKSAVNLDEEAADLIRYQQAYEAASRVISTTQTLFNSLIEATR